MSSNTKTPDAISVEVLAAVRSGMSNVQVAHQFGINEATVRRIRGRAVQQPVVYADKKQGGFNWRDSIPAIKGLQDLRRSASWSQQNATIKIGDGSSPVAIMVLSDMHIGSMGTDYDLFVQLTDVILQHPNLFVAIVGDEVEWAVRLRSVAEVCAQVLDPQLQLEFITSWLDEILPKVIFATWSNHSTDRSEQMIGTCPVKNILAARVPFFSGIGHAELIVGEQTYWVAVSHRFKGVTQADSTAGCKRYMRLEWTKAEIAIQGDCHRAGVSVYNEGNRNLVAISSGTLNVHSGYAARNFSLFTSTAFPIIQLFPNEHMVIPYYTIEHYLKATQSGN
jgi:hypothetical protein